MTYKSIIFWGGLVVLDSFLFMGLPERLEQNAFQQPRLEPVHCWEGVDDGRQVAVSGGNGSAKNACQGVRKEKEPGQTMQPQIWNPDSRAAPERNPRLQVNISIYRMI